MESIAFAILVTVGATVLAGLVLLMIGGKRVKDLCDGQPDREAAFLATEMAASYDAAKHVREEA